MNLVGKKNKKTREMWLEKVLKKIPNGFRILDAGAGELQYKKFCNHLDYVSQDFAEYNGKADKRGLQKKDWNQKNLDIISDIVNIPEPNASFDAIMCVEVFEHLSEPIQAIKEFERLLKPNGHLIITAPFCSLTHFAPYHFYSGFNKYFYEKHLNGFEIIDIETNGNFFEYLGQETRRVDFVFNLYVKRSLGNRFLIFFFNIISKVGLKILNRFSKNDLGSEEILNHGFHIHAKKNGEKTSKVREYL